MGKAKPASHTARELAQKAFDAQINRGGGKTGMADRLGGAAGSHAKFQCPLCGQNAPGEKSGADHWESKHKKMPFVWEDWADKHAEAGGVTTAGVGVRGKFDKKK